MNKLILLAALALGACSRTPPPEPVKVMVPTPCVSKKPERPNYPIVTPETGLFDRVKALLAERELRRAYEGELEATVNACD